MRLLGKIRFNLSTMMMLVLTVAAAAALFAKVRAHTAPIAQLGWQVDVPSLFLLAIVLTAVALGAWKDHTAVQTMLQIALTCVGCLSLTWIVEAEFERAIRYWFQGTFAATVTLPLLARRFVKSALPRGPHRDWWKKNCEAVFFSFLNMMLVTVGGLLQAAVYLLGSSFLAKAAGP